MRVGRAAWSVLVLALGAAVVLVGSAGGPSASGRDSLQTASHRVVVRAPWGSGAGELGRRGGDESAPEGPMSFAPSPDGGVIVLDQANARVARWDAGGTFVGSIPIGADTFQDVALGPGGEIVLMDRLALRVVRVLSPNGTPQRDITLEGDGIPEGGGTTGLFVAPDGVWVEYEHGPTVRVADERLRPVAGRRVVPGRPWRSGAREMRGLARPAGPHEIEVWTVDAAVGAILSRASLAFQEPVARIVGLGAGDEGEAACAVHLLREDPARGFAVVVDRIEIVLMDGALAERRRISTEPSAEAWEQFKEFDVAPDGSVWRLVILDGGVEVRRWAP
ncbi:MAG: hypothetical protein QME96_15640 [Myxococcota bacterium]|nr:hypothetical protein [Myxococcota bacterium]